MRKTRIAVLGTLAELHREPIHYNLDCLTRLVKDLNPDLLCAELQRDHWERGDWEQFPVEYREALVPLAQRTDIVIVPIQGREEGESAVQMEGPLLGPRHAIVRGLNCLLRGLERLVDGPWGVNTRVCGYILYMIGTVEAWVCGVAARRAWYVANRELLGNVMCAVRRDPGVRMLVTVECRRRHRLVEWLGASDEVELVGFQKL